jgi:hypothetical protein
VHDKKLVEAFVDLLESGAGVRSDKIFCSSLKGQGIRPGNRFVESIGESLGDASCVVALISEAYYSRAFCMCELGATWITAKRFYPVIVPPVEYKDLKAVLAGMQVLKVNDADGLDELRDELAEELPIAKPHRTPRWNERKQRFLNCVDGLVEAIAFDGPVPRVRFEELEVKLAEYQGAYEEQLGKVAKLNELVASLKKAKDASVVAQIVQEHEGIEEQFSSLVEASKEALSELEWVTREAMFYHMRGDAYEPDKEDWSSVEDAEEEGELSVYEGDHGVVVEVDSGNSSVFSALESLKQLEQFLGEPPEGFADWYREEYEGGRPWLRLRPFWNRHLR